MEKTIRQLYEDYHADMVTAADKARLVSANDKMKKNAG